VFKHLKKIIDLIDKNEWNRAKTVWILLVCRLKISNNLVFDTFDTEYNAFIKHFVEYQRIEFACNNCKDKTAENINNIILMKEQDEAFLSLNRSELCEGCLVISSGQFSSLPSFILVEVEHYDEKEKNILISDIPLCFNFNNTDFNFLFATIFDFNSEHFRAIFRLNSSFYLVDDLSKTLKKIPTSYKLCSIFYYLV
jgi:hypothetical protein